MRILRKEKDFDSALATIKKTLAFVKETKGLDKINARDVEKQEGKVNSFSAIKKAIKMSSKRVVRESNRPFFERLTKIVNGEITLESLLEELYEPEQDGETIPEIIGA